MPGPYTDHHVHLLSTAAARLSIDVSGARDIPSLVQTIKSQAQAGPGGLDADGEDAPGWIRAWGYEEWKLAEGRHPSRDDLDQAAALRPLVLHHQSGHAAVLNTAALHRIGADDHPDGILFDRQDLLARVPRLPARTLSSAAAAVSREWAEAGVEAIVDATHTNGEGEVETLAAWAAGGVVIQRMTAMLSIRAAASLPPFGCFVGQVQVGWVKLMPSADRPGELVAQVAAAHEAGYPVAVHVVDIDVLEATLDAFEQSAPPPGTRDRIEHNALCLPEQLERIAASGAMVVVNPGFLLHRRRKYEAEIGEVERTWLVRVGSLLRAGIDVRAGSDSPVTEARPQDIIAAAMDHPFSPTESVSREEAERLLSP